jgi:hypothetical protein
LKTQHVDMILSMLKIQHVEQYSMLNQIACSKRPVILAC